MSPFLDALTTKDIIDKCHFTILFITYYILFNVEIISLMIYSLKYGFYVKKVFIMFISTLSFLLFENIKDEFNTFGEINSDNITINIFEKSD